MLVRSLVSGEKQLFTVLEQAIPSYVEELWFYEPAVSRYKMEVNWVGDIESLAKDWQATVKEIFAPAVRRGVKVQTMALEYSNLDVDDAAILSQQWEKRAIRDVA